MCEAKGIRDARSMGHISSSLRENGIRVLGDITNPLFCAIGVAAHIDDKNVKRCFKKLDETDYTWILLPDNLNRQRQTRFLTESGIYTYLVLNHKNTVAVEFRKQIKELLANARAPIDGDQLDSDEQSDSDQPSDNKLQSDIGWQRWHDYLTYVANSSKWNITNKLTEALSKHELTEAQLAAICIKQTSN